MSKLFRSNPNPVDPVDLTNTLEQISLAVYKTTVSLQQQQPEWIVEKQRQVDLSRYKIAFVTQLKTSLEQMHTRGSIATTLERFLQKLVEPDFFKSEIYQELLHQIDAEFLCRRDDRPQPKESIAILLLDAENIKLNHIEEEILFRASTYPIKVKIAFANWRSMGRHDADLHDRSYQMIHVPNGKNAADIQMTAIGASLFLQYPHAKEVFVCSSDAHMITLCNLLQTQGWKVHAMRKWGSQITLVDWTNGRIKVFAVSKDAFDPKVELEQKLVKLMLALTVRNPGGYIPVSSLASQFKKHYETAVTDVMKSWDLGSHFLRFLQSSSAFNLKFGNTSWQVAIRPIKISIAPTTSDQTAPV